MKECSFMIKKELLTKLKNLGSFIIRCIIGDLKIERALCDLSSSINFIPLSIFKKFGSRNVKSINIAL